MKKIIISVILVSGIFTTILSSAKDSISTTGFIFGINAGYAAGFNKEENISTNFFQVTLKVEISILEDLLVMIMQLAKHFLSVLR